MTLIDRVGGNLPRGRVTVELDDIQATVLRYRPAPYFGTHVMLHVDDARAGREFLRRLTPHVDSAADWWRPASPGSRWRSAIRAGGARACRRTRCRASRRRSGSGWRRAPDELRDDGVNDPKNWEPPFGSGLIHIGVSAFSDSEETWRRTMDTARAAVRGTSPASGCWRRRTSAPSRATSIRSATRTGIGQPADRGQRRRAAARPGPADQGRRVHPRLSRVRPAFRCRCRSRTSSAATAPTSGCASISRASATFNRFLRANAQTEDERELLAAKLVGRWRSGAPLTLAPDRRRPGARRRPAAEQRLQLRRTIRDGRQVPLGSHMRRMNPRDTETGAARPT